MNTIYEIFGSHDYYQFKNTLGLFGIEIETETKSASEYGKRTKWFETVKGYSKPCGESGTEYTGCELKNWKAVADGSLRDFGIEYVMKSPKDLFGTLTALDEFKEGLEGVNFHKDSSNTSVHVHINMLHETPLTLANFIQTWLLLENMLVEYCGTSRRSNQFARPARVSEGVIEVYCKILRQMEEGNISAISTDYASVKYAALNVGPLCLLGSIEARTFRGTTDAEEIKEWIKILHSIYTYAKTPGLNPIKILEQWRDSGWFFVPMIFGPLAGVFQVDSYREMTERNLPYVQDIALCVSNWDTFGLKYIKVKQEKLKTELKAKTKKTTLSDLLQAQAQPWTTDTLVAVLYPDDVEGDTF